MFALFKTLEYIANHPLNSQHRAKALLGFFKWQIGTRLVPGPVVVPFVNSTKLLVSRGMSGATGNIYAGLHEFEDMSFVLHLLRMEDLFVDVGANVGAYTVLAGGAIGSSTVSFEPVPSTFHALENNVRLNAMGRATLHNCAVGDHSGAVEFTSDLDTVNHVAVANGNTDQGKKVSVPMQTLDDALNGMAPTVLKIDVEGFETAVICGANQTLQQRSLLAVLMELNGSGSRYGFNEERLHQSMLDLSFQPCRYRPFTRELVPLNGKNAEAGNTIYVRSIDEVSERLKTAPRFCVNSQEL